MLSKKDIEEVVSNGTPFLFKSALESARRMRAFLGTDGINVGDIGTASTVDIMKYIISYASNPSVSSERNGLFSRQVVDLSVRNLLHEMSMAKSRVSYETMPTQGQQIFDSERANSTQFGPNIQMKRGDWICSKCNFMNFARNVKCLECEEIRPKRLLVGSEWECPQCNFYNYGRNTVCLRCDQTRPGSPLLNNENRFFKPSSDAPSDSHFGLSSNSSRAPYYENQVPVRETASPDSSNQHLEQDNKSESWFGKMAELHNAKDLQNTVSDKDNFPDTMPIKKNNRSITTPKYKRQVAMDEDNNTKFVPFVPFPPGYFSTNNPSQASSSINIDENSASETTQVAKKSDVSKDRNVPQHSTSSGSMDSCSFEVPKSDIFHNGWTGPSLEGSAVKETEPLDMSEEAKAERWFKRVAQIKDISELSQIPDEDFPSIMPMRKGVNRFVVSKRKTPLERRLTSQQYRRNLPVVTNNDFFNKDIEE